MIFQRANNKKVCNSSQVTSVHCRLLCSIETIYNSQKVLTSIVRNNILEVIFHKLCTKLVNSEKICLGNLLKIRKQPLHRLPYICHQQKCMVKCLQYSAHNHKLMCLILGEAQFQARQFYFTSLQFTEVAKTSSNSIAKTAPCQIHTH